VIVYLLFNRVTALQTLAFIVIARFLMQFSGGFDVHGGVNFRPLYMDGSATQAGGEGVCCS